MTFDLGFQKHLLKNESSIALKPSFTLLHFFLPLQTVNDHATLALYCRIYTQNQRACRTEENWKKSMKQ